MSDPILETRSLVKVFRGRTVVNEVSIALWNGEVVGLLGPNGAGKTTTFSMIVGLLRPTKGTVVYHGKDITKLPMYRRAREGIAYLPQEPSVFRNLTAFDNILAVLEHQPVPARERKDRAQQLIEELDLTRVAQAKAYTLSGGERRRVEIGRALATKPSIFLLDEPFAGIDPIAVAELQEMVYALRKRNIGILITDHNVRETLRVSDHSYIISEGKIVVSGTPREIANDPLAREIYLGHHFDMEFE
ncbi:MAG: LPS export ABC transporter ATP-binding protein [Candidatus Hydrogenedentes bacterium]|nr:LPS export ABC transporter ATP-binding protein [Candidatus Hydrogenedentota bacterium]